PVVAGAAVVGVHVLVEALAVPDHVVAVATLDDVGAVAALDRVVAGAAQQRRGGVGVRRVDGVGAVAAVHVQHDADQRGRGHGDGVVAAQPVDADHLDAAAVGAGGAAGEGHVDDPRGVVARDGEDVVAGGAVEEVGVLAVAALDRVVAGGVV